ncbi:MAG: IS21 family transposase [Methylococcaceae bacterium]
MIIKYGCKTALKSYHPRLFNNRHFAGESWSDINRRYSRNQTALFSRERKYYLLAAAFKLCHQTIRKHLKTVAEAVYSRQHQPQPKFGAYQVRLETWLKNESTLPRKQRRSSQRLYECRQVEGYKERYRTVQRYVKVWKKKQVNSPAVKQVFVPLAFPPGETCQFDWSQETVEFGGVVQTIKVAHFRLTYSRQLFIVAYPREKQEMVLDAHIKAFSFFAGVPTRMVYENLKTVADAIFASKGRQFNARFLSLANHYLFGSVACTSKSGLAKAQA